MDKLLFVQNIKAYCSKNGIKPTVACKDAGVGGSFINNIEARGQVPSVEKVQMLAQYLGVTVSELLGETGAPILQASDLTEQEQELVSAYRAANDQARGMVDFALEPFKEKKNTRANAG